MTHERPEHGAVVCYRQSYRRYEFPWWWLEMHNRNLIKGGAYKAGFEASRLCNSHTFDYYGPYPNFFRAGFKSQHKYREFVSRQGRLTHKERTKEMTHERPEHGAIATIEVTPYIILRGRYIGPDKNNLEKILVHTMGATHSGTWIKLETREDD